MGGKQPTAASVRASARPKRPGAPISVTWREPLVSRLLPLHSESRSDWTSAPALTTLLVKKVGLKKTCLSLTVTTYTMAALRSCLPPSAFALHSRQFQRILARPTGLRYASSTPPPKPRLLEKPERFNPPSHPSRLRSKPRSYGAPLSEHDRQAQKTRSYPHMMPAEGTFTYWFLTNRSIHLWISIVSRPRAFRNGSH